MELSGTNQPVRPQIGFSQGWGLGTNLLTPTSPDNWTIQDPVNTRCYVWLLCTVVLHCHLVAVIAASNSNGSI